MGQWLHMFGYVRISGSFKPWYQQMQMLEQLSILRKENTIRCSAIELIKPLWEYAGLKNTHGNNQAMGHIVMNSDVKVWFRTELNLNL